MPTPKRGARLGGGPAHQKLLLAGMASDLFRHGRIRTTVSKAKTLRPYAERLITKAKQGDLHARRQVLAKLRDRDVVAYLFEDVAPRFADRNGGYTRILKLGPRQGDAAPMALIELVEQGEEAGGEAIEEAKRGRSRGLFGRRRRRQPEAAEGAVLADLVDEDVDEDEEIDDEQVAAAVARATGQTPPRRPAGPDVAGTEDDAADADDATADTDDEPTADAADADDEADDK